MTGKLIDLYLINGFLGSGKTTFLLEFSNHLSSKSKRCGLIINEFGEVNIDSIIFSDNRFIFTEISNGSIFCSCLHGNFIEALIQFATNTNIDVLLIEASGLTDPSSIDKDLTIVEKKIMKISKYKGAICIIDAKNFLNLTEVIQTINCQIEFSNITIINKIDLVTNPTILAIENKIRNLNPQIQILKANFGVIILKESLLKGERIFTKDSSLYEGLNTPSTRTLTLSLITNHILSIDKIISFTKSFIRST